MVEIRFGKMLGVLSHPTLRFSFCWLYLDFKVIIILFAFSVGPAAWKSRPSLSSNESYGSAAVAGINFP